MTMLVAPRAAALDRATRTVARGCPVCLADDGERLYDNAMVGIDRFGFGYPVVACRGCGAAYAARALAPAALADYYRTLSKYDDGGSPSALDAHRARLAARFAAAVAGHDARLLDVGCATGTFLVAARACGMTRVAGIEPAPGAIGIARERHGLDVAVGDANTYDRFADHDVVTLLAVLEHLAAPRAFVERVARALRPGALLIVEVPDADAFGGYEAPGVATEPFGEFSIEHINFFGEAALARLGRLAGLSVVAVERARYVNGAAGVFVAFRNDGRGVHGPVDDGATRASLVRYVARGADAMRGVDRRLAAVDGPVVVYGAGSHTARLLARPAGRALDVRAIVDRNANLVGRRMAGVVVAPPEAIALHAGVPVLVSSFHARESIGTFVERTCDRPTVRLYAAPAPTTLDESPR